MDVGYNDHPNPFLESPVGFDRSCIRKPENYAGFITGDAEAMDRYVGAGSFDTVVAGETLEHLENGSAFLRSAARVVGPGGRIVLSTPNPYHPWTVVANLLGLRPRYRDHLSLYSFRAAAALARNVGLRLDQVEGGTGVQVVPFHPVWSRQWYLPAPAGISRTLVYTLTVPPGWKDGPDRELPGWNPLPESDLGRLVVDLHQPLLVVGPPVSPMPGWASARWVARDRGGLLDRGGSRASAFAAAVVYGVLEHRENPAALLREIRTALRPGATLITVVPNPYALDETLANLRRRTPATGSPVQSWPMRNLCELLRHVGFLPTAARGVPNGIPVDPSVAVFATAPGRAGSRPAPRGNPAVS